MEDKIINNKIDFLENNGEEKIHIGFGIDDNYLRPVSVLIASLCTNNKNIPFHFHVMTTGLLGKNIAILEKIALSFKTNITIYDLDIESLKDLPTKEHLPMPTYFRFLLPKILRNEQRLYYLDGDMVCVDDISPLLNMPFDDKVIMAVKDLSWMQRKREKALNLPADTYFNAGLLIINLPLWEKEEIFKKVLEAIKQEPDKFRYLDQDGLNIVLSGKVKYLDKAYNFFDKNKIGEVKPKIIHFAAHPKPWHIAYAVSEPNTYFPQSIYDEYEVLTPFKDEEKDYPQSKKEFRIYAKALFKNKEYLKGLKYYCKYLKGK